MAKTILIASCILLVSCHNEPYELLPLSVASVKTGNAATSTYTYRNKLISTFSRSGTLGSTSSKFYYSAAGLDRIVSDSTENSYNILRVTGTPGRPQVDSLFNIAGTVQTLVEARRFTYESSDQLTRIEVTSWSTAGITQSIYDLDWEEGNIVSQRVLITDPLGAMSENILTVTYDDKAGIYYSDLAYVYTLPLNELYWLSANNPVGLVLNADDEVALTYTYNKFGYPAQVRTDRGLTIAHSYTELR